MLACLLHPANSAAAAAAASGSVDQAALTPQGLQLLQHLSPALAAAVQQQGSGLQALAGCQVRLEPACCCWRRDMFSGNCCCVAMLCKWPIPQQQGGSGLGGCAHLLLSYVVCTLHPQLRCCCLFSEMSCIDLTYESLTDLTDWLAG